ncbi:MAG TPA: acylphosphatase [Steroidobacteraceae bacterium]
MSDRHARRCLVSGRVQGVFFRASTRQRAAELGLAGHAKNLADGRVEVLVVGPAAAVQQLCDWLWIGPPSAKVTGVEITEVPLASLQPVPEDFRQD